MNFLELAGELSKIADVSGVPASVDNVRGEHKRIVDWVRQAWREIQAHNDQWSFMWKEAAPISISNGVALYSQPTDCRDIIISTVFITGDDGVARSVAYKKHDEFRVIARSNSYSGVPQYWTVRPDNKIQFAPVPDGLYQMDFEYYKKPVDLSASTDTPELPQHLHMAIVYLALYHYGVFEEAPSVMQMATVNYNKYLLQISNECLPEMRLGGALV